MKPIALTTPKEEPLRINPLYLTAWGPATFAPEPGGPTHRGSFVVVGIGAPPRFVLESVREIDTAFEVATEVIEISAVPALDQKAAASEVPVAG